MTLTVRRARGSFQRIERLFDARRIAPFTQRRQSRSDPASAIGSDWNTSPYSTVPPSASAK